PPPHESGGSAGPWLFAIARHVLGASVRRGRIEQAACARLGVLERLDREPAIAEPTEAWLDEALAELPDDQQRALELRFVDDLAYADVAASLQTTPGAARVRVHRGLAALRDRLTREER
ncbi:MAG TPA: sigma-70 family RNA polymerase sigma factor, partial [Gaiellaceae bacterium]|nr:sigma-70 family RNA polymerase sigma factor [Gaiellaceae bacterium]